MSLGRKLLLLAAFAAIAAFVVGGTAPVASGVDIDKKASVHGTEITDLTLSLDQTITVDYEVIVTKRECAIDEVSHESVDVFDSFFSEPLAIHLNESRTFKYSRDITAHTCDDFDVTNTATVNNNVVLDSDTVTIHVDVACERGCTLTQGYWKTHSVLGPASKPDSTWDLVGGPNTTFFYSGQSWYQVFWTSASGGNVYYQLAHQYMAAVLNKLNGASSTSAVDAAITAATNYFNNAANTPSSALNLSKSAKQTLLGYASTLGSYNEGLIGPGHCDE